MEALSESQAGMLKKAENNRAHTEEKNRAYTEDNYRNKRLQKYHEKLHRFGKEILDSPNFHLADRHMQHGKISVKQHSEQVALMSLRLAHRLPFRFKERELVRGALLHDYFLYDWHHKEVTLSTILHFYQMHGFTHPTIALKNASHEFELTDIEKDIIKKHMWPLTLVPPMCREAWVVTAADKYCSLLETLHLQKYGKSKHGRYIMVQTESACR